MLRPLWESREHYEELKQLDDAVKEVKAVQMVQADKPGTCGQAVQRTGEPSSWRQRGLGGTLTKSSLFLWDCDWQAVFSSEPAG